jgi:hypothetical protein
MDRGFASHSSLDLLLLREVKSIVLYVAGQVNADKRDKCVTD